MLATKLIEIIADPCNAKEHYQSVLKKKNTKSVKQLKIITMQAKTFENPNIVDIKSVIIEYPKTSHKLSKSIRQAEKVSQVSSASSFYTKKIENILNKKCNEYMLLKVMEGYI